MSFRRIKEMATLKTLMLVFAAAAFASPVMADSREDIEVTLSFGWRNSDRHFAVIENYINDQSFPFTVILRDERVEEGVGSPTRGIVTTIWFDYYHSVIWVYPKDLMSSREGPVLYLA